MVAATMIVKFEDVVNDLVVPSGDAAKDHLDQWVMEKARDHPKVYRFVKGFCHKRLFDITYIAFRRVVSGTKHALGDLTKDDERSFIEDAYIPFALQYLFHEFIERTGRIPTWEEFFNWIQRGCCDRWLIPMDDVLFTGRDVFGREIRQYGINAWDKEALDATHWRLAKFYYACLRELDLLLWLRDQGINAKYHILADVVFGVDIWVDRLLVQVYVKNDKYKSSVDGEGRKVDPSAYFSPYIGAFDIHSVEIPHQGKGIIWLSTSDQKQALLKACGAMKELEDALPF
jgi:hypothetical protein